jgi:hypothetical protein
MNENPTFSSIKRAIPGVFPCGAVSFFAHYTWMSLALSTVKVGQIVAAPCFS